MIMFMRQVNELAKASYSSGLAACICNQLATLIFLILIASNYRGFSKVKAILKLLENNPSNATFLQIHYIST